jgi:hypothetical protein
MILTPQFWSSWYLPDSRYCTDIPRMQTEATKSLHQDVICETSSLNIPVNPPKVFKEILQKVFKKSSKNHQKNHKFLLEPGSKGIIIRPSWI